MKLRARRRKPLYNKAGSAAAFRFVRRSIICERFIRRGMEQLIADIEADLLAAAIEASYERTD